VNAWIDAVSELMGIGHEAIELSPSYLRMLLPEGRLCCLGGAVVSFCLLAAWQDARVSRRREKKADTDREQG